MTSHAPEDPPAGTGPAEPSPAQGPTLPQDEALPEALRSLLRHLPKAELHLHLDGSLRPVTALELAHERGLATDLPDEAAVRRRLMAPPRCRDQAELLEAFALPIAILQDAASLERVTHELVEDVAAEATRYVEIRWAPGLHTQRGLGLRDGLAAVVAGARSGSWAATREGHPVTVRLIAVAMRSHEPALNEDVARAAAAFLGDGVTGFDLAGPEAAFPDPMRHARAFAVAREAGLGITLHAGEWGGAAQVWRALALDPARIAHGAPAADDPALMGELIARGVTLDLCPTSNVQAGLVERFGDHPLPRLLRASVPVTLSTDDRTVSDLTLVREYSRAMAGLGLSLEEIWRLDRHALEVAFLQDDEATRVALRAEFEAFAAVEPALAG